MARNQIVQLADFMRAQAFAVFEFYRFQPEFCYLFVRCDMNMRRLPRVAFITVEEKSVLSFSQDCWHQTIRACSRVADSMIRVSRLVVSLARLPIPVLKRRLLAA